jgi:cytochrome c oxidase subunit 2
MSVSLAGAGSLDPQGPVAEAMADLWWLMLALGVAVFAVVVAVLMVGLFRGRRTAEPEPGSQQPARFSRWLLFGGVVGPLLVLVVVFVATVQAMRFVPTSAPPEAMVIEVVGRQWSWEVRYPDQGITATNELHIPVGRRVNLQLRSVDVIHSFWVPELGGKMDLLPERTNTLVLQADQPGVHRSRCAEFCGLRHTDHRLTVVAEPQEQFDAWVAERRG